MMNKKGPMLDAIRNKRGNSINLTITVEPEAGLMTGEGEDDKEIESKDQEQLGLAPEGEMDKSEVGNEPMMGQLADGDAAEEAPVMDDNKKALMDEILMKKLGKNSLLNRAQRTKQA